MRCVFVSNFFNHHQQPFSDEMYKRTSGSYRFIETAVISEERKALGWGCAKKPDYVLQTYKDKMSEKQCIDLICEADIVIYGSAPRILFKDRFKNNKLTFRYSERIFKRGICVWERIARFFYNFFSRTKKAYLLCASAYAAADFNSIGMFRNKTYKWGYFPKTERYDMSTLQEKRKKHTLIWVGRLIDWKHPEKAIQLAAKLKQEGFEFTLNIIGIGAMRNQIETMVEQQNLNDCVHVLGAMPPEAVRNYMLNSEIFLFTSDFNEGWGAVLNEAMNSGCAVVTSHAIGAAPFLIQDGINGILFNNDDFEDFYGKVKNLLLDSTKARQLGLNAYAAIQESWNAEIAASRFLKLAETIEQGREPLNLYRCGICSRADQLRNNWYVQ